MIPALVARIRSLWRGLRRRSDVEAEMTEEFRLHVELRAADLVRSGLAPTEAERRARLEFGHSESHKQEARTARGLGPFDELQVSWLDFKLGFRMLVKYPGLTLVGGLGIAVAVAIGAGVLAFSTAVYASLPLDEGDRVVAIEYWDRVVNTQERQILHDFVTWRDQLTSVQDLGAFRDFERNLIVEGHRGEPVQVAEMTASGFRLARVPALLGRSLVEDDELEGAPPVIVIGYDVWQRRFAADPQVVGRSVRLGAAVHTVVGVMPQGFGFPISHSLWVPLRADPSDYERRQGPGIRVFGRRAPGVTLDQARAELTVIARRAAADFPKTHAYLTPRIMSYPMQLYDDTLAEIPLLHFLVGLLLVAVCVNVAILVYARTAMRHGEIALRSALGASRRRIVTQLFVEALVLSVVAVAVGLAVAGAALSRVELFSESPFWINLGLSSGTVAYALALAVLGATIVGVVPALKATGRRVRIGLQPGALGGSGMRLGKTWTLLIISQVAVAVAVLPTAVSTGRTGIKYGFADPGFAAEDFLTARLRMDRETPPSARAEAYEREFEARYGALQTELVRRLGTEPGVSDVILAVGVPGEEPTAWIEVEGLATPTEHTSGTAVRAGSTGHEVGMGRVDVGFFDAFEVPTLTGRRFEPRDLDSAANAVIVNRAFASQVVRGGSALGRRIRYIGRGGDVDPDEVELGPWYEIVGVVDDFPPGSLDPDLAEAKVYHPVATAGMYGALLILKVEGGVPVAFAARLRDITAALDPTLRLDHVLTLDQVLRQEQAGWRLVAWGFALVTLSVLLLSAAGIYALMSFTVTQRRREIGIRSALGADPHRLLRNIFSRALGQLAIGVVVGLVAAPLLLTVDDPLDKEKAVAVLAVSAIMIVVGLLAAIGPARRGLRIQPTEALKADG